MEKEQSQKIAVIEQFQVVYQRLSDYDLSIAVCNMDNLIKYEKKNVKLTHINFKGLQMALNGGKDFKADFQEVQKNDTSDQPYLQIKISFKSFFVMSISETLVLPFKCTITELELSKAKIEHVSERYRQFYNKHKDQVTIVVTPADKDLKSNIDPNYDESGDSQDYSLVEFQTLYLPDFGKYHVQISMYLKSTASYFYFYNNISYQTPFGPNACIMLPNTNQFIPIQFSFSIDNRITKDKQQKIYAYDIVDYPIQAKNIVITLKKLD